MEILGKTSGQHSPLGGVLASAGSGQLSGKNYGEFPYHFVFRREFRKFGKENSRIRGIGLI
jgi:hypothetical protein